MSPSLEDPLDDFQDSFGVGLPIDLAIPEGADRERHCGVGPLCRTPLIAVRNGIAGADVREELGPRRRRRRLGEGAADVDSGVIVGAADPGAAVGLDVDEGRKVQLLGARAVARLPDREELRQAAAVTGCQRRL